MWKWTGLTLTRKIQIVKTFAIPKFMSHVSNDLIQAANKEYFNFIWKGNHRIKRCALNNDIEYGGLKMMDLESMIRAQSIMCLKNGGLYYFPELLFGKSRRKAHFAVPF